MPAAPRLAALLLGPLMVIGLLLGLASPAGAQTRPVIMGPATLEIPENTDFSTVLATYTTTAADFSTWTILFAAPDGDLFRILGGELTFNSSPRFSPDYEAAADQGADNVYNITLRGHRTDFRPATQDLEVTITVTNVDEPGAISAITGDAQVGATLTAGTVTDEDSPADGTPVSSITHQWQSAVDGTNAAAAADDAAWPDISGATSATYEPVVGDVGRIIRVVATYTDGEGGGKKVASAATGAVAAAATTLPVITFDRFEHTGGVVVGSTTFLNVGDTLTAFVNSDKPLAETSLVGAAFFDFDGSDRTAQNLLVNNVAPNQYMATYTITAADNDAGPQFNVRGVTDTADPANTAPDFRHSLGTVTIDTATPTIALNGGPVTVAHGGTYTETEDAGISGAARDETPAMTTTGPDAMTVDGIVVDTTTPGAYLITYIVTDRAGNVSDPLTRTVTVAAAPLANTAPTSDAGPDQPDEVVGSPVTLDGSGSSDSETARGDLIYFWSQAEGPDVDLSNDRVVSPTFTPPRAGTYRFDLTVTDTGTPPLLSTDPVIITVSEPVAATTPEPPVLSAGTPTHNSIALSWGAVDNADSYTLTRVVDGGADVVVFSGNALTATDENLDADTEYKYTITAINSAGMSTSTEFSARTVAAPAADTTPPMVTLGTIAEGVIGTAQDYDITFSEAVTGLAVIDFSVSNDIVASGDLVVNSVTPASGPSTTYTISITPRATAFTLTLTADSVTDTATTPNMGPAAEASATGTATVTAAPPGAPTGLTARPGDATVTLAWTAPGATGGADITGYEYRQSDAMGDYDITGSAAVVDWMAIPNSATATEYTVTGLTNDTAYFFQVRAVNSVGKGEVSGEATATPTATDDTTLRVNAGEDQVDVLEGAMVNLDGTITNPGTSPVILWTHTRTNGADVTPGEALAITGSDIEDASFTAPYVTADTTLTFELSVTPAVEGSTPVTDMVDIIIPNVAQPRAITGVTVNDVSTPADSAFAVSWTQEPDTDKDPTTGFDVEYKVTGAGDDTYTATNVVVSGETAAITGLTADTGYTVRVRAKAGSGTTTEVAGDYVTNTGTTAADTTVPGALALPDPDDQGYTVNTEITALELPAASGGTGTLSYTLTGPAGADLPDGLDFNAGTRTLSGTPGTVATTTLTYTVTDDNGTAMADFTVTVALPPFADLNRTILPEVARAIAGHTVGAIARRVTQARADGVTDSAGSFNLGGQTTVAGALASHGQAMADGTLSLKDLLGGGDFVLPLNARAAAGAPGLSSVAFWGAGDYSNLDGSGGAVDWDGDLFSAHLGADARLRDDLLVGLAVSWSRVDLDYSDPGRSGDYELDLTSFHPYVGWSALSGKLDLWATVGYGWGDLEIADEAQQASSDVEMRTVAVGGLGRLLKVGATTLRLKGDALLTEMEVEGSDEMAALTVDARRVRMILEGSRTHTLADGAQLEPSLEVGVRHDGGDGETGFGAELGGGVRYSNPVMGLTLEGRARTLVGRDSYGEWGVNGLIRLERGNGRGLSFNLSPGYGKTGSGTQRLWQQGLHDKIDGERDYGARMDLRLGYGLPAFGGRGLLTPYSEVTFGDSARNYRLGMEWELGALFELNLTGERHESSDGAADHAIMLKGEVRF